MKKITSFLTALLMFFALPAFAQLEELKNLGVVLGDPVEEFQPETWYVLHNSGRPSYPYSTGPGEGTKLMNSLDLPGTMISDVAGYLVRFIPTAEDDTHFYIQTGLGDYWGELTQGGNNGTTVEPEYYFIGGKIEGSTDYFWFKGNDGTKTLDNNTPPSTVAGWNDNIPTNTAGNAAWQIISVSFEEVDPILGVLSALLAQYMHYDTEYNALVDPVSDLIGTKPGQYSAEAVAALKEAIDAAEAAYDKDGEGYTVEQLEAITQAMADAYEAVLASRVPAEVIPDGYYFIKAALDYHKDVTIGGEEDPETGEIVGAETVDIHPVKAMVDYKGNAAWMTISSDTSKVADDLADCTYLWKLTHNPETGYYQLVNMAFGRYIKSVTQSANIPMTSEGDIVDYEMNIVAIGSDPVKGNLYSMRRAADKGDYQWVHQGGHGGGAGESGNCVGWTFGGNGIPASTWYITEVDETLAQTLINDYAAKKDLIQKVDEIYEMVAVAKAAIVKAKDITTEVNKEKPVISDPSQFTSPFTQVDEGSIEELFDGDPSTYWHSSWSGGSLAPGSHYFIIEDVDNTLLEGGLAIMVSRRSSADNDHPTKFMVYGANEIDAETWTELGEIRIPYTAKTDVDVLSTALDFEGQYKYFRFNCTDAAGSNYGCRGYFHMSELQVYPAKAGTVYATTQYKVMGNIVTDLEAAMAALPETADELTQEQYDNLKKAYEAFIAIYVDPAPLRTAVATARNKAAAIVVGTDPGYWTGEAAGELNNMIASAQAYDEGCAYTPAKSEEYIAKMTELTDAAYAQAVSVKEGKWYSITFPAETMYEAAGWDKAGAAANEGEKDIFPELFGKTLAVGMEITDDATPRNHGTDALTEAEDVSLGNRLYFIEDTPAEIGDAALFRFINVGDSAYLLQNKLTGLYVKAAGATGQASLSVHPTLFKQSANGFGTNLLKGIRLDGENQNYLHAQRDGNVLVTWSADGLGSNSCMMIHEVGDVTEEDIVNTFNITVYNGAVTTHCYPVEVKCIDGDAKVYVASIDGTTVTLSPLADGICPAGNPFVLIYPVDEYIKEADDDSEDSYVACQFEVTNRNLVTEPATTGSLIGTYYGVTAPKGSLVASENTFAPVTKTAGTAVGANKAYIDAQLETTTGVNVTLVISEVEWDNIGSTIAAASKNGVIYTLDGKAVGRGNLNSLTSMPRGIYVVNGVKVAVK